MNRKQVSIMAIAAGPLFALAACTAEGPNSSPQDDTSETQQGVQTCTSTCNGGNSVSCTSQNSCVTAANGVTCDGVTTACSCANIALTVTTNPVGSASAQNVTWTAHPVGGSGNYSYTWVETWCFNGNAPGDCNGSSNTETNTSATKTKFSNQYSEWDQYCVTVHDNTCPAYGNSNTACARVEGEGKCFPGKACKE